MSNSGAKAALKGYRLQAFYILDELLNEDNHHLIFQPEGMEDLAIYDGEKLLECIQVKNRTASLTLSDFSPEKEDGFFNRVVKIVKVNPDVKIKVISYGDIGPEISNAWNNVKPHRLNVIKKLTSLDSKKFSTQQVNILFNKIDWEHVHEKDVVARVSEKLSHSLTSGSPEHAFSLLIWWIYEASENKKKITYNELINKIHSIGKYFAEREAHHKEWYTALTPLVEKTELNQSELAQEFYQGVSSRFTHIQLGLDICRSEQLLQINELFKQHKIVIIHGASGQGKTSLAYRYLLDYVPETWRLQINYIVNQHHAKTIALAIADHLSIFKAPLYLYIDVAPRDIGWVTLIKSLLDIKNIKIIITIRSEDLARQTIGLEELSLPALLQVNLYQEEAQYIYTQLLNKNLINKPYPTPKQAWVTFGSSGSLLEYIYFLTQTTSLKEKLSSQIKKLNEDVRQGKLSPKAIKLLLGCAIATSYESRVDIALIAKKLSFMEIQETFCFFENEYLLRKSNDKRYVEALHPIRSRIITELLIDPAFSPWIDSIEILLPCLCEEDIGSFLMYSFSEYPETFDQIFSQLLNSLSLTSWQGIISVCNALIWYGIYQHIEQNEAVILEAEQFVGKKAVNFLLLEDVSGTVTENPIELLIRTAPNMTSEFKRRYFDLRNKLTSRKSIFTNLTIWLNSLSKTPGIPQNKSEWDSFSETLLWLGYLNVSSKIDISWIININIDIEDQFSSIDSLASFLYGLFIFKYDLYKEIIEKNNDVIEKIFQYSTNTFYIEQLPENPIAHYIVPLHKIEEGRKNYLNQLTVERAELLRKIYPEKDKFGAKGYGHIAPTILNEYGEEIIDESDKPGILKSAFPTQQLVKINAIWNNFNDYSHRPNDWQDYINIILVLREKVVQGLKKLIVALESHFKKTKPRILLGRKIDEKYWNLLTVIEQEIPLLPKVAVDRWGFSSEQLAQDDNEKEKLVKHYISIQDEYKQHLSSINKYISSICNFYNQSKSALFINSYIGRNNSELRSSIIESTGFNELDRDIRLSLFNLFETTDVLESMQSSFKEHFRPMVNIDKLENLEKEENLIFKKVIPLWYQYCFHPEKIWKELPLNKSIAIYKKEEEQLINQITTMLENELPTSISAYILDNQYPCDSEPALWIQANISEINEIDTTLEKIINILFKVVNTVDYPQLKYFIFTKEWKRIIIIPMIENKTLSNLAWKLPTYFFMDKEKIISGNGKIHQHLMPLDTQAINYFQLKELESFFSKELNEIRKLMVNINNIIMHFSCFVSIVDKLDDLGYEVLISYLNEHIESLKEYILDSKKLVDDLKIKISEEEFLSKEDLLDLLIICDNAILPYEGSNNEIVEIDLKLSDTIEWSDLLQQAIASLISFQSVHIINI